MQLPSSIADVQDFFTVYILVTNYFKFQTSQQYIFYYNNLTART